MSAHPRTLWARAVAAVGVACWVAAAALAPLLVQDEVNTAEGSTVGRYIAGLARAIPQ
ncbi:MAG: hypothetical protein MI748_12990 [Opitutales bacterium]|nr:hypothetical protein [Opitutales bacterium]